MAGDPFDSTVDQIRSYGAVAVLGAGLSMERYPMTRQLTTLLGFALDAHPDARNALAGALGEPDGPAKQLLVNPDAIIEAWRLAEGNDDVRFEFQRAVARHDLDQEPLDAHRALARLIRAGLVHFVVSFNWDTALERAYEQYFGVALPGGVLAKPHGDATEPDTRWVLPHEAGIVTDVVRARMADLVADRPRLLLVVGYSWSDPAVVADLYEPVRDRWPVASISPSASAPDGIAGKADEVLPRLADELGADADAPGWLHVTYGRRRDIGAALYGHKLGPQDVDACPSVPAVKVAAGHLRAAHFAVISGDSGSGKSLAAFQAARVMNDDGWAVVELVNQGVATDENVRTFSALPGPVVAVVDDAQAMKPAVRLGFERAADGQHAVLMVSTDRVSGAAHSTIDLAQAVATLVEFCRDHRSDIEGRVAALDDRIGQSITQERYLDRVDEASKAKSPWEFMFTLGGGDRRITDALTSVSGVTDGPLLLGLLAASHTLSLDAGVDHDRLCAHARDLGFDSDDVEAGIEVMLAGRLATNRDGQLRTAHLRFSQRALQALCADQTGAHWERLTGFLRSRVTDAGETLLGRLWLMRHLHQVDAVRYGPTPIVTETEAAPVLDEALLAASGRDRSIAGAVIWEIGWWHALDDDAAARVSDQLVGWISDVTSDEIYGVQEAFSALRASHEADAATVASQIPPEVLAAIVSERLDVSWGREWGQLILGLRHASGIDEEEWSARFEAALDVDQLVERVVSGAPDALWGAVDLIHQFSGLAPAAAARCIQAVTPMTVDLLQTDMPLCASYLVDWGFGEFIFTAQYIQEPTDVPAGWVDVFDAIVALVQQVDWSAAGASVAGAELRDLEQVDMLGWSISGVDPDAWTRAVAAIDFGHLDALTVGLWEDPSRLDTLVSTFALGADPGYARRWVESHRAEIRAMYPRMTKVVPDLAVALFAAGGTVDLGIRSQQWSQAASAIRAVSAVDAATARKMVLTCRDALRDGLLLREKYMTDGFVDLVDALDDLDPGLLGRFLGEIDLDEAGAHWRERLAGSEDERAAASLLMERVADA